jgi:hypothetical protein
MVFWGSGETWATQCPGGIGPLRACAGSNDKIYAFRLGIPGGTRWAGEAGGSER